MLGDFFLQTNEVSLERVGGQPVPLDASADDDLIAKSDDIDVRKEREKKETMLKTFMNKKPIPGWFMKSKSVKMSFHVFTFNFILLIMNIYICIIFFWPDLLQVY